MTYSPIHVKFYSVWKNKVGLTLKQENVALFIKVYYDNTYQTYFGQ